MEVEEKQPLHVEGKQEQEAVKSIEIEESDSEEYGLTYSELNGQPITDRLKHKPLVIDKNAIMFDPIEDARNPFPVCTICGLHLHSSESNMDKHNAFFFQWRRLNGAMDYNDGTYTHFHCKRLEIEKGYKKQEMRNAFISFEIIAPYNGPKATEGGKLYQLEDLPDSLYHSTRDYKHCEICDGLLTYHRRGYSYYRKDDGRHSYIHTDCYYDLKNETNANPLLRNLDKVDGFFTQYNIFRETRLRVEDEREQNVQEIYARLREGEREKRQEEVDRQAVIEKKFFQELEARQEAEYNEEVRLGYWENTTEESFLNRKKARLDDKTAPKPVTVQARRVKKKLRPLDNPFQSLEYNNNQSRQANFDRYSQYMDEINVNVLDRESQVNIFTKTLEFSNRLKTFDTKGNEVKDEIYYKMQEYMKIFFNTRIEDNIQHFQEPFVDGTLYNISIKLAGLRTNTIIHIIEERNAKQQVDKLETLEICDFILKRKDITEYEKSQVKTVVASIEGIIKKQGVPLPKEFTQKSNTLSQFDNIINEGIGLYIYNPDESISNNFTKLVASLEPFVSGNNDFPVETAVDRLLNLQYAILYAQKVNYKLSEGSGKKIGRFFEKYRNKADEFIQEFTEEGLGDYDDVIYRLVRQKTTTLSFVLSVRCNDTSISFDPSGTLILCYYVLGRDDIVAFEKVMINEYINKLNQLPQVSTDKDLTVAFIAQEVERWKGFESLSPLALLIRKWAEGGSRQDADPFYDVDINNLKRGVDNISDDVIDISDESFEKVIPRGLVINDQNASSGVFKKYIATGLSNIGEDSPYYYTYLGAANQLLSNFPSAFTETTTTSIQELIKSAKDKFTHDYQLMEEWEKVIGYEFNPLFIRFFDDSSIKELVIYLNSMDIDAYYAFLDNRIIIQLYIASDKRLLYNQTTLKLINFVKIQDDEVKDIVQTLNALNRPMKLEPVARQVDKKPTTKSREQTSSTTTSITIPTTTSTTTSTITTVSTSTTTITTATTSTTTTTITTATTSATTSTSTTDVIPITKGGTSTSISKPRNQPIIVNGISKPVVRCLFNVKITNDIRDLFIAGFNSLQQDYEFIYLPVSDIQTLSAETNPLLCYFYFLAKSTKDDISSNEIAEDQPFQSFLATKTKFQFIVHVYDSLYFPEADSVYLEQFLDNSASDFIMIPVVRAYYNTNPVSISTNQTYLFKKYLT